MKNKINLSQNYIVILVIINFSIIGLYYTYAAFVTKQIQENVAMLSTDESSITLSSELLTDNSIIVKANSEVELSIKLLNELNVNLYYKLFTKGVPTGVAVYYTESINDYLTQNSEDSADVKIINNLDEDVTITFACQTSLEKNFDKEIGYSYINNSLNYDHSGANSPNIDIGRYLPVFYEATSETEGSWKIADKTNTNSDAIWYDYDNQRWANMVLVNEEVRDNYLNSEVGTIVLDEDILSFFVWVPAFKYNIVNSDSLTVYENDINVVFVNQDELGTVTCQDDLRNLEDEHVYSEVCTDQVYDKIYNNLSTYRPKAFNINGKNISGFWISKFQVSGNGERVLPNATPTVVKYDMAFRLARNYDLLDNKYGLFANGSELLEDGTIVDDKNNYDSHLLTNREWGAVAILSNSLYGKSGNQLYFTDTNVNYKRIYVNNYSYDNRTGCSSNYSISTNSFIVYEASSCIAYNDLSNYTHTSNTVVHSIGPVGPGASTSGTVYGVYDMVGGNQEMVSSIIANNNGIINTKLNSNYYDSYSYNEYIGSINSWSNAKNIYRYKLGDGIREHFRSLTNNGMWYSGSINQSSLDGYMVRGGTYNNGVSASIYSMDIVPMETQSAFRISISVFD